MPEGPCPSLLMIVGECPSEKDVASRRPFVGTSGWFLDTSLRDAGLSRSTAFLTHVGRSLPPRETRVRDIPASDCSAWIFRSTKQCNDNPQVLADYLAPELLAGRDLLRKEILLCRPHVVIALGNVALWALTGLWGDRKWRSSILQAEVDGHKFKVIPTYRPGAVLREFSTKGTFIHDLRRAKHELSKGPIVQLPEYKFVIRPTFEEAKGTLDALLERLEREDKVPIAADIETRGGHTACIGLAWSKTEAISIPWMCVERIDGFWPPDQELTLRHLVRRVLSHPKAEVIWQNGDYDHQYEYRWSHYQPNLGWDTMVAHHTMFSVSPKALDHLSSLYCDYHRYWKDDGRNWDPSSMPEEQYWTYNAEDCVRTFEIAEREQEAVAALTSSGWAKLPEIIKFQHDLQPAVVRMMLRGVRSDDKSRREMEIALMHRTGEIQAEINTMTGEELNPRSPKQMTEYFYGTLNQSPIYSRLPNGARGNPTCDDSALATIAAREPALRPLINRLAALRSAGVFLSTFVRMPRDIDGRLRCSYNIAGTKTYRFASRANAFGSGGNLQNIPSGDDDEDALILLPNIRKLFLFDEGKTGFDIDGDSADLRVVTGESGCRAMQAYFAAKAKPYVEIAKEFYRDPTITKHHPSYKSMKALCHGSNYGGEAPGLSQRIGLPVHDVERMQKWYFGMCPEIKTWQDDIKQQGEKRGYIENPFGYRLYNWDRWSRQVANEFLAWTPQSTVGILINRILLEIDRTLPNVELLLQVHDSLTGQFPSYLGGEAKRAILAVAEGVKVPCRTGDIVVPAGIKTSNVSWGDCE